MVSCRSSGDHILSPEATTRCYFPVTFGFCVLLNQSINQSKCVQSIHLTIDWLIDCYHTLLLSSDFWILCAAESINQSIKMRSVTVSETSYDWLIDCYRTLLLSSDFWILCATESINQSIKCEIRCWWLILHAIWVCIGCGMEWGNNVVFLGSRVTPTHRLRKRFHLAC